jgi:hypothetical protein
MERVALVAAFSLPSKEVHAALKAARENPPKLPKYPITICGKVKHI